MKCEACKIGDLIHTDNKFEGMDMLVCNNEKCQEEYID